MLAALNFATFLAGPRLVLAYVESRPFGAVFANFVFDSWGTLAALMGAVILFAPILFGARAGLRKSLSFYFFTSSVSIGVAAALFWNFYFRSSNGGLSNGASAIDIAAQSVIFTLAIYALSETFLGKPNAYRIDPYVTNSLRIVYGTLIVTTVWFIFFLEPVFVPTVFFNWRVHEVAFVSGFAVTAIYLTLVTIGDNRSSARTKMASGFPPEAA